LSIKNASGATCGNYAFFISLVSLLIKGYNVKTSTYEAIVFTLTTTATVVLRGSGADGNGHQPYG
jgi:NhaP-type Na+/H+ and K+/H+ antiporter